MKGRRIAILLVIFFPQFVFASLPSSICTVLYKNELGVQRVSFDCGKTFQIIEAAKTKYHYVVNWEKRDRTLQSGDGGRTWYELKQKKEMGNRSPMCLFLFGRQEEEKIIIEVEESGNGTITIFDFLGKVIYNRAIHLNKGRNGIELPFQLSRSSLYFGMIKIYEKNYNFLLFTQ